MFRRSKVSVRGRWIISLIFVICLLVPELVLISLAPRLPYPKYVIGMSVVRLIWSLPLFWFMMLGHDWARYITIVLFSLGAVGVLMTLSSKNFIVLGIILAVIVAATAVLIFSDEVKGRRRSR